MTENSNLQEKQLDTAKKTIINNLKVTHQSKLVNITCAISHLDENPQIFNAFKKLIREGVISSKDYYIKDDLGIERQLTLYRYNIFNKYNC